MELNAEQNVAQDAMPSEDQQNAFHNWCFQETVEMERTKQSLRKEKDDLTRQKRLLEQERKDFIRRKEIEDRRIEQEHKLFDMKWQILEGELKKLANEKQQVERQREFFERVTEFESRSREETYREEAYQEESGNVVKGELFFAGVDNSKSLKKRYKDLIKIYHPDNLTGDTDTLQEINREYEKLQDKLE